MPSLTGEQVSSEMVIIRENNNLSFESAERLFELHNEMMKNFRRAHAKVDTIDSRAVKKDDWWAFVTVRMKIHDRNLQN